MTKSRVRVVNVTRMRNVRLKEYWSLPLDLFYSSGLPKRHSQENYSEVNESVGTLRLFRGKTFPLLNSLIRRVRTSTSTVTVFVIRSGPD